jgi:hypothetical protein
MNTNYGNSEAYDAGYSAYYSFQSLNDDNPYLYGEWEYYEWREGWQDASNLDDHFSGNVYS